MHRGVLHIYPPALFLWMMKDCKLQVQSFPNSPVPVLQPADLVFQSPVRPCLLAALKKALLSYSADLMKRLHHRFRRYKKGQFSAESFHRADILIAPQSYRAAGRFPRVFLRNAGLVLFSIPAQLPDKVSALGG